MMKHTHTEPSDINFAKLESRIMNINSPSGSKIESFKRMLHEIMMNGKPTLIMATGGSKVIAYYLESILEKLNGIICEVIEPRDYFYKSNKDNYSNLIVISASSTTNGIKEALLEFKGNKYLICEKEIETDYQVISWGNELYDKERSFISLATSIGPITLLLECATLLNSKINSGKIQEFNDKIRELLKRSANKISQLSISFKDTTFIQIMSGYETKASSCVLESNLVEVGLAVPIIHDKGSYCHGRSNLLFQYPQSHIVYLSHRLKQLDQLLIQTMSIEYENVSLFETTDLDENSFWKEYYLMLQMYFLSKKMADDKNIDLTQPEYNPKLVKTLYSFKGEM